MSADPQSEVWVSTGERLLSTGKLGGSWRRLQGDDLDGDEKLFAGRTASRAAGAVYEVKVTRDDKHVTLYGGIGDFVRQFKDVKLVAEWQALTTAARVAARRAADERKAKTRDAFEELLAPIARAYLRADPNGRQVILAKALQTILRGAR